MQVINVYEFTTYKLGPDGVADMVNEIEATTVGLCGRWEGYVNSWKGGVSGAARFSSCEVLLMLSAILQIHPALLALKIRNQIPYSSLHNVQCFLHKSPEDSTGNELVSNLWYSLKVKKWVMVLKLFKCTKWGIFV
jgi:hypothetical protein